MTDDRLLIERYATHDRPTPAQSPRLATESNVWLVAQGRRALLIDAGFAGSDNTTRIVADVAKRKVRVVGIYLTHGHPDHILGAPALAAALGGCPVHCHPLEKGRIEQTWRQATASDGGADSALPNLIADLHAGASGKIGAASFLIAHTPGHTHGHIALFFTQTKDIFTGDTIVPSGSVWIGPPDGHMTDYLASLEYLLTLDIRTAHCGHGPSVPDPVTLIGAMSERRHRREAEIVALLSHGEHTVASVTSALYGSQENSALAYVTQRTVLAHIQRLEELGCATARYDPKTRTLRYRISTSSL